jgi:membrane protein DedA with SNARE-associated domain
MINLPGGLISRGTPTRNKRLMNEVTQFLMAHGHPVLFAIVFVEQAGLPLPAAPWLLAAGALSANGNLSLVVAIGVTFLACVMADWGWFLVGRRGGQRVLRGFCRLSLARTSCVGRTKSLFERYGLQGLVVAKFLPGLGAVMPPLAGAMGMSPGRFLLFDGLGSMIYGAFYIVAGFLFHNQLRSIVAVLHELGFSVLLSLLVLLVGHVTFKYIRRRRAMSEPRPQESPAGSGALTSGEHLGADWRFVPRAAPRITFESPETSAFENPSLSLTRLPARGEPEDASASLIHPAPCEI